MSASEQELYDVRPIGQIVVSRGFDLKDSTTFDFNRLCIFPSGSYEVMIEHETEGHTTRVYPSGVVRRVTFPGEEHGYDPFHRVTEIDGTITYWRDDSFNREEYPL